MQSRRWVEPVITFSHWCMWLNHCCHRNGIISEKLVQPYLNLSWAWCSPLSLCFDLISNFLLFATHLMTGLHIPVYFAQIDPPVWRVFGYSIEDNILQKSSHHGCTTNGFLSLSAVCMFPIIQMQSFFWTSKAHF